jgi:UDP-3-O-[3-hydroxymyristoyl] glucosamine N-acyltransferase
MELSVVEIAELLQGDLEGDNTLKIRGVAKIEDAGTGEISFISNPKYVKYINETHAAAVIVSKDFPGTTKTIVRTENPYVSFLKLLKIFHPPSNVLAEGIHPSAVVHETVQIGNNARIGACVVIDENCTIGENATIYPGVVIGREVQIGNNTIIYANVVLREQVQLGNNVIIHSGTVVGSDGFGFAREGQQYHKIPQVGTVIIEDDVEIGANCTIDRATLGRTIIHKGVKLDNLIQVAHNVEIGENTVIAAQTGISGSTKIGTNTMIGGQVGFVGHIEIGDNTTIGAQSGVSKSLPADSVYFGYPARPIMQAKREEAALRKLPDLLKRVAELESKLNNLQK